MQGELPQYQIQHLDPDVFLRNLLQNTMFELNA